MKILSKIIVPCVAAVACLLAACATSASFPHKDPVVAKLVGNPFRKGERIPLAHPRVAPYRVNDVYVTINVVFSGAEGYVCSYNLMTYSPEARCEIKSVSIEGLPGPPFPSTGEIKVELTEPMPGIPAYQAHRSQGLHYTWGYVAKGIKYVYLEESYRRNKHLKATALVKVVNHGITEERKIVYIYERLLHADF